MAAANHSGAQVPTSSRDLVLVTGASGFIGSALVKHLVEAGWRVRALLRPTSPRAQLAGLRVEYAEGDINAAESVTRAVAGVRYVFHVAADYRLWARQPSELMRTNVDGTRTVMLAAQRAAVERIVYTSSVATLAPRPNGESSDESSPLHPSGAISAYKQSKVLAERLVESLIADNGLPAVIVNPSAPIGPRDVRPTPLHSRWAERLARADAGRHRAPGWPITAEIADSAWPAVSAGVRSRGGRPGNRSGAICDGQWPAHGQAPHVLYVGQSRARIGVSSASL
jgi:nucleoside-diphosphate-sugar epimerase